MLVVGLVVWSRIRELYGQDKDYHAMPQGVTDIKSELESNSSHDRRDFHFRVWLTSLCILLLKFLVCQLKDETVVNNIWNSCLLLKY